MGKILKRCHLGGFTSVHEYLLSEAADETHKLARKASVPTIRERQAAAKVGVALPDGWKELLHHALTRTYPTFHGPHGEKARSKAEAIRKHEAASAGTSSAVGVATTVKGVGEVAAGQADGDEERDAKYEAEGAAAAIGASMIPSTAGFPETTPLVVGDRNSAKYMGGCVNAWPDNSRELIDDAAGDTDEEVDDTPCEACGTSKDPAHTLLCDGDECGKAYHLYCLQPPLSTVPVGRWLCPACKADWYATEAGSRQLARELHEEEVRQARNLRRQSSR